MEYLPLIFGTTRKGGRPLLEMLLNTWLTKWSNSPWPVGSLAGITCYPLPFGTSISWLKTLVECTAASHMSNWTSSKHHHHASCCFQTRRLSSSKRGVTLNVISDLGLLSRRRLAPTSLITWKKQIHLSHLETLLECDENQASWSTELIFLKFWLWFRISALPW